MTFDEPESVRSTKPSDPYRLTSTRYHNDSLIGPFTPIAVWYVLKRPYDSTPFHSGVADGVACLVMALIVPATEP